MDVIVKNLNNLSLKRKREDDIESVVDSFKRMVIYKKIKTNTKQMTECTCCEQVFSRKCLNCYNDFCIDCYECKCGDCILCCKGDFCSNCNSRTCEKVDDIFICSICECKFCEDCRYVSSGLEICHECIWF